MLSSIFTLQNSNWYYISFAAALFVWCSINWTYRYLVVYHNEINVQQNSQNCAKFNSIPNYGDRLNDTFLMGQFNYFSNHTSVWTKKWSDTKTFDGIIVAMPKSEILIGNDSVLFLPYPKENGFVSPYTNIGKVIRKNNNIGGLLYVHDDLMITKSILKMVRGSAWIISDEHQMKGGRKDANQIIRLYENGEFYLNSTRKNISGEMIRLYDNGTIFVNKSMSKQISFVRWPMCKNSFLSMYSDPMLDPYRKDSVKKGRYLKSIDLKFGQSDMLYMSIDSKDKRDAILELIDLFSEHKLFLDCAIATLVSMTRQRFNIEVYDAPLCTSWSYGNVRNDPKLMVQECITRKDVKFEIFHPIKIGQFSNWTHYFDAFLS